MSAVERRDRVDEPVEPAGHRGGGQQQRDQHRAAGDQQESRDRVLLGRAAQAGVLGALHEEAVEEVDDQAGRPEGREPALGRGIRESALSARVAATSITPARQIMPSQNGTPRSA